MQNFENMHKTNACGIHRCHGMRPVPLKTKVKRTPEMIHFKSLKWTLTTVFCFLVTCISLVTYTYMDSPILACIGGANCIFPQHKMCLCKKQKGKKLGHSINLKLW